MNNGDKKFLEKILKIFKKKTCFFGNHVLLYLSALRNAHMRR